METNPEKERDTIAWFRVGVVVASALAGMAFFVFDAPPAAYFFFLGYALYGATMMLVFKIWRSSSEVAKVRKSHLNRLVRNIPRGIFWFLMGLIALIVVLVIGVIPALFTSSDFYDEHERLWYAYGFFLVAVSMVAFFWVGGFIKDTRQSFSDLKEIRDATKRTKERRAKEKRE